MNRKERRRLAKLGPVAGSAAPCPPPPIPAAGGGFGAGDALAVLAGGRPTVPPPSPAVAPATPPDEMRPPAERELANAVYYRTLDALRTGRSVAAVAAAVRAAAEQADALWATRRPAVEARKSAGLACAAGCAWCCYQQVVIEPTEAIAIAHHIRTQVSPELCATLENRIAATDEQTRGLGILSRARRQQPCAFLDEGRCSIYGVRPLRCRGVYSRDADHCRWAKENPDPYFAGRGRREGPGPYPVEPTRIVDAALTGLHRATRESGLPWPALELVAAVRTALAEPNVSERYLAGEAVFADAVLPPRDDALPAAARPGLAKSDDSP